MHHDNKSQHDGACPATCEVTGKERRLRRVDEFYGGVQRSFRESRCS